jgi:hypothetical protein
MLSEMRCHHCGYDLTGVPDYGSVRVCPECSETTPTGAPEVERQGESIWLVPVVIGAGLALILFVLGWVGAANGSSGYVWIGAAIVGVGALVNGGIAAGIAANSFQSSARQRAFEWTGNSVMSIAFCAAAITTAFLAFGAIAAGAALGAH